MANSTAQRPVISTDFQSSADGKSLDSTVSVISPESNGSEIEIVTKQDTPKRSWRFYGTIASLALINLICAIDATILAVALPTIATALKGTAIEAFWCGTSFLLTSTVFQPTWASLSHVIGRKKVVLAALILFTTGTIIASVANDMGMLLAGRSIQGVGGGGLVGLTYVILTDMVTLRERGKWFALISLQWAVGSVIGPVIGGAIAEKTSWRWLFLINLPFCAIAGVGIPVCLRLAEREGSVWARLKKFDWFGSFLFVASTTSFLLPVTWGGVMYEWSSWHTLVPLILGIVGLISFVLYSAYLSPQPLIRKSLLSTGTAAVAGFGSVVLGLLVWSMLFYLPLYFEVAKNFSPVMAGVALFPLTFTVAPGSAVVGIIVTKTGRYRPSVWIGFFLATFGSGLLIYVKESTTIISWVFLALVVGVGTGMLFSALAFAAQAPVSNADLPFAGALYSFFRSLGQMLGVGISGSIFQNSFKGQIKNSQYSAFASEWSRDASSFVQVVKRWSTEGEEGIMKAVVVKAYVDALRMVWIVLCVVVCIAFVCSLIWIKAVSLERIIETEQAFIHSPKKSPIDEEKGAVGEKNLEFS